MKVLFFDFETTGTNPELDFVLEIGAVLWDVERKFPLEMYSSIVKDPKTVMNLTKEQSENAGGITTHDLDHLGASPISAWSPFYRMLSDCDYWCGHNAVDFDQAFFLEAAFRLPWSVPRKLLLDSLTDIEYPSWVRHKNLLALAAHHGFVNPFPHRALTDSLTTAMIVSRYDITQMIDRAAARKVKLIAKIPKPWTDGGKAKEEIKKHGYGWDGSIWSKEVLQKDILEERGKIPYSTDVGKPIVREWWLKDGRLGQDLARRTNEGVGEIAGSTIRRGSSHAQNPGGLQ